MNKRFSAPPGWNTKRDLYLYLAALGVLVITCMGSFLTRYSHAREALFIYRYGKKMLIEGAMIPPLGDLLLRSLYGFWLVLFGCFSIAFSRYMSFFTETKSIYVMKRLSDPKEIRRMCFAAPALGLVIGIILSLLLFLITLLIYRLATPAVCLPSAAPLNIWRILI